MTTSARRRLEGPWTDNRGLRKLTPLRIAILVLWILAGIALAAWLSGDLPV